jgi:hypothetical protein
MPHAAAGKRGDRLVTNLGQDSTGRTKRRNFVAVAGLASALEGRGTVAAIDKAHAAPV